ncbi:trypsin-like peptidase domain-containing protein [Streptomyces sp. NPDC058045]|uniref:trypsin-like peptidase domain-containing protein n=1 Tax=Streptomyces sp. NPDC058045 TaxID=3346311 RepID=UPI0036E85952
MQEPIHDAWRVRILDGAGPSPDTPPGTPRSHRAAGVLLPGGLVLTCAHVIQSATDSAAPPPDTTIAVDFPGSRTGAIANARLVPWGWAPPGPDHHGDIAVLRLDTPPPEDVQPTLLHRCGEAAGRRIRVFGQSGLRLPGIWARAELVGSGGLDASWVQIDATSALGSRIRAGYSGAGVVDEATGQVIGIVVAEAHPAELRISWMIPTESALALCPPLAEAVAPEPEPVPTPAPLPAPAPVRTPPPSTARWPADAERRLAQALVLIPSMRDPKRRNQILDDTGPDIALRAERSDVLLQDIRSVVHLCLLYPDGIDRLTAALRWYEEGSLPLTDFEGLLAELRPDRPTP